MRRRRAIEKGERVAVTGAAGFIGTHVVETLLRRGYRVRGTVRDASDEAKTEHLRRAAKDIGGELELASADLLVPGSFDDALRDCSHVCHVASSVRLTAKDPQREIVDVAVRGTLNVLDGVEAAGCARRVVLASSIAAVIDQDKPLDHVFDEDDWNDSATVEDTPYPLSKVMAERAAWDRVESRTVDAGYDLVTINPTLVLGPMRARVHRRSSPAFIVSLMSGQFPLIPNLGFGVVDVRDVAEGIVRVLEREDAGGRHILDNGHMTLVDMAAVLRRTHPDSRTPRRRMPDPLMYVVAMFDKRMTWSFLRRNLGVRRRIDNGKSRRDLGLSYRPLEETLRDTADSVVALGLDKRK